MSRRKRQPEQFDVVEFLRESDDDLKSALNSLLRSPAVPADEVPRPIPGPNLEPDIVLNQSSDASDETASGNAGRADDTAWQQATANPVPGNILEPEVKLGPTPNLGSGPNLTSRLAANAFSEPGIILRSDPKVGPDLNLAPPPEFQTGIPPDTLTPGINLIPGAVAASVPKKRQFPIREMKLAQDAHTRAEQQVYEYLWQNAKPIDDVSRSITIGFGAMARMVRLSESNARINARSLIAKLAMEDLGEYNCERSIGRTYRIFNYSEILRKRREAGLLWYMRRTLAVVFVDPKTGQPIDLGLKKTKKIYSGPGPKLGGHRGLNLAPESGAKLTVDPGINLDPLIREEEREKSIRETSSSSDSLLFDALSQYGVADDEAIKRLRNETKRACPDFTDDELVHFIHSKGHLIRRRDSGISSPIGFLLASVPKCFAGEAFQLFRKNQRETREREAAERAQQEAELDNWRREQQAILDDPIASEEDKRWARKMLYPEATS